MATKHKTKIDKNISIEDLVEQIPQAITYLMEKGIRCLRCGEPIWGTLESAAEEKGFNNEEIELFVAGINSLTD